MVLFSYRKFRWHIFPVAFKIATFLLFQALWNKPHIQKSSICISFIYTVCDTPTDFLTCHREAFIFYLVYSQYKQVLGNENQGSGK